MSQPPELHRAVFRKMCPVISSHHQMSFFFFSFHFIRGCFAYKVTHWCDFVFMFFGFFFFCSSNIQQHQCVMSRSRPTFLLKCDPFKRLATETKRGALQHTLGCRAFPLSFSITNGGHLSLSVELNFFPLFSCCHCTVSCTDTVVDYSN